MPRKSLMAVGLLAVGLVMFAEGCTITRDPGSRCELRRCKLVGLLNGLTWR